MIINTATWAWPQWTFLAYVAFDLCAGVILTRQRDKFFSMLSDEQFKEEEQ